MWRYELQKRSSAEKSQSILTHLPVMMERRLTERSTATPKIYAHYFLSETVPLPLCVCQSYDIFSLDFRHFTEKTLPLVFILLGVSCLCFIVDTTEVVSSQQENKSAQFFCRKCLVDFYYNFDLIMYVIIMVQFWNVYIFFSFHPIIGEAQLSWSSSCCPFFLTMDCLGVRSQ